MKPKTKTLAVRIPVSVLQGIDEIANERELSVPDVARMCLELGVLCHQTLDKLGLVGVIDLKHYTVMSIMGQHSLFSEVMDTAQQ